MIEEGDIIFDTIGETEYYELRITCPRLEDGKCNAYKEERPEVCKTFPFKKEGKKFQYYFPKPILKPFELSNNELSHESMQDYKFYVAAASGATCITTLDVSPGTVKAFKSDGSVIENVTATAALVRGSAGLYECG